MLPGGGGLVLLLSQHGQINVPEASNLRCMP